MRLIVHSLEHRRNARLRVVDVGVVLEGVLPEDPHEPVLGLLPLYDTTKRTMDRCPERKQS